MATISNSQMLQIALVPCSEGCCVICLNTELYRAESTANKLTVVKIVKYVAGGVGGFSTIVNAVANATADPSHYDPSYGLTRNIGIATLVVVGICTIGALALARKIQNTLNDNSENSPLNSETHVYSS